MLKLAMKIEKDKPTAEGGQPEMARIYAIAESYPAGQEEFFRRVMALADEVSELVGTGADGWTADSLDAEGNSPTSTAQAQAEFFAALEAIRDNAQPSKMGKLMVTLVNNGLRTIATALRHGNMPRAIEASLKMSSFIGFSSMNVNGRQLTPQTAPKILEELEEEAAKQMTEEAIAADPTQLN